MAGDKQPVDSGNYVGKFSLLNRSDSGDEDDNDVDDTDNDDDDFIDVVEVSSVVCLAWRSLSYFCYLDFVFIVIFFLC